MRDAPSLCVVRHQIHFFLFSIQLSECRSPAQTYAATLLQEVEFVAGGEGDALSLLSIDSVVGERRVRCLFLVLLRCLTSV